MDHACAERSRFLVHRSWLPEYAIESPIDINFPFARMPHHPYKPVFHRAAVEVFDDVEDFQTGPEAHVRVIVRSRNV